MERMPFGKTADGKEVSRFKLTNAAGAYVQIINYGGIITAINLPDREGRLGDVVLGYDSLEEYVQDRNYFGAIIGRTANRTENACFELEGVEYKLGKNEGNNHLHGGVAGFNKALWDAEMVGSKDGESLLLSYLGKDGEEGYPGNLQARVRYTFTDKNELVMEYGAISDRDTVVNLTNHSYFNLSGHQSGSVLGHKLMICGDRFTPIDSALIPSGEIRSVAGTPMDFMELTAIGARIGWDDGQLLHAGGYDHNWILGNGGKVPEKAAEVVDETSGRVLEVFTTKPGIQFYSGNFLDSVLGKEGALYGKRSGFCLETQYFPNSMKHKHFPSPVLKAGEEYRSTTIYRFSVVA
ncbi:galactose mutarotase [Clostridiales bacterium F-3ap]|uniref:Aldose 1-epimerase n=1 Tax=Anaerotalea alkaliphila TaxID=2662126 RepID=A0A7X5KNQ0_9FIRM|nr:galactose mutarotase [Anaerotalea alkaliphila]